MKEQWLFCLQRQLRLLLQKDLLILFFDNDGNRARKIFAYLFSVFIAIFVNLFFYKPIFNFLSILLGLSAIALSYNGTIKRKCMFVFYILAVSCLIDLVVSAFLIKPFGYDGYSAFVSIFALLLLHAAQLVTERFFGNDLGIELNNRYWLFIIASLLVCIVTSIVIFMDKNRVIIFSFVSLRSISACEYYYFISDG